MWSRHLQTEVRVVLFVKASTRGEAKLIFFCLGEFHFQWTIPPVKWIDCEKGLLNDIVMRTARLKIGEQLDTLSHDRHFGRILRHITKYLESGVK